jgi:hypothetical protein
MRNEDLLRLSDALAGLPEHQRRAEELHHLKGLVLTDVAAELLEEVACGGMGYIGHARPRSSGSSR